MKDNYAVELSRDELLLIYGAMVEAWEALDPAEFRARVGLERALLEPLRKRFKMLLIRADEDS
jgi:hypothetical protein